MPLTAGTRLGSYEIRSLVGEGGMGTVYRARDAKLQRDIALKVLSGIDASDADRRARFTREALAVAALNHPHIVTIHSVEDAGDAVFLTMELIQGRALADAIPPEGMPLERVLAIGIAVTEAISTAHGKGILHRDLKPGNIMLGEGEHAGRIKVLDFGLAKFVDGQPAAKGASLLPTVTPGPGALITGEGRILGTVAYMSPEQAEGTAIDARSDLFSLGVVLYEMSTGRRPFTGATSLSILSSILKDTPPPITDVNPRLPADFGRIVRRALAKDPERRYQSAKDLRNDLEDLRASLGGGYVPLPAAESTLAASLPPSSSTPATPAAPSSDAQVAVTLARRHPWALAAVAASIVVGGAAIAYLAFGRSRAPSTDASAAAPSLADVQITQLTTSGTAARPTISPDGHYVAYVQDDASGSSLWIRQTSTPNTVRIVAPEPGVALFGATFTPDATSIDFVRQAQTLPAEIWRIPFLGGTPRPIVGNVASPISWAPDGRRIAFLRTRLTPTHSSELVLANADGSQEQTLATSDASALWISLIAPWRPSIAPAWSPDGRLIAIAAVSSNRGLVTLVDRNTGSRQVVGVPNGTISGLSWLDDRALALNLPLELGRPSQLLRFSYPSGDLSPLTNDPNDYMGISVSGARRELVTGRRDARMDLWVGDAAGAKGTTVVQRVPISVERVAWSGDRLIYGAVSSGRPAIFRVAADGGAPEEVVLDALAPGATSDGRTLVFVSSSSESRLALWTADANGRWNTRLASTVTANRVMVTPDDRHVIYISLEDGTVAAWMVPIGGGTAVKLSGATDASVSPDGRLLALAAPGQDGQVALVVCSLPDCASKRTIGAAAFDGPIGWSPDGHVVFAKDGNLWASPMDGGPPRQLTRFTDGRPIGSFEWSRDGKRLALTRSTVTNDIVLFRGVK